MRERTNFEMEVARLTSQNENEFEVIGTDSRISILDGSIAPYSWICSIWELGGLETKGTGVLVGPRHVLTCAHVLDFCFDPAKRTPLWNVRVAPGKTSKGSPLGNSLRFDFCRNGIMGEVAKAATPILQY
jgi:V8-like Glu-specific endopeptidase